MWGVGRTSGTKSTWGWGGGDKCVGGETCHDKTETIMERAGVE